MKVKGYVLNNTGRSRHIFKQTVYPGQKVDLDNVYLVLKNKVPKKEDFAGWLANYLPEGWDVVVEEKKSLPEESQAKVKQEDPKEKVLEEVFDDGRPSLEYLPPAKINKLSYRDIYELKLKDNPKRIVSHVDNVNTLRRALTLCNKDSRKKTLGKIIRHRLNKLAATLK